MVYMITLSDGRLFATTETDLHVTVMDLHKYEDNPEDIRVDGPYPFVEIDCRIGYDPQEFNSIA